MSTVTKQNNVAKLETNIAYKDFEKDIHNYYSYLIDTYKDEQKLKVEKLEDRFFKKSIKNNDNIKKIENQKLLELNKEEINDDQINQIKIKYENKIKIEKTHFSDIEANYRRKVSKLNSKVETNIKKYEVQQNKRKELDLSNLTSKKENVNNSNNDFIESVKAKLDIAREKKDSKISEFKNLALNKKKIQHNIEIQNKKFEKIEKNYKLKIQKYEPTVLTKEIVKQKIKRRLHENFNSKLGKDVFSEMEKIVAKNKIIFVVLILLFYTSMNNSYFWKLDTLFLTMNGASEVIILGMGMTLVIITGGIDLSVGSVMAFSGVLMCSLAKSGTNIYVAIIIGIIVSTLIGLMNGILIGYAKIVPFIVTLAGLLAFRGAAVLYSESQPIHLEGHSAKILEQIANSSFLGINSEIWIVIIFAIIFIFILKFTVFGRQVYAIGSNRKAANLSGVKDKKVEMIVYSISGFMAGVAALLLAARVQGIQPTAGNAWELKAIAATVLGGTALTGGKGGILGTLIGWIILSMMPTVFITLGYNSQIEKVATGLIIVVAIFFNNNLDFKGGIVNFRKKCIQISKKWFVKEGS